MEEDRITGDIPEDCILRILSLVDTRTFVQCSLLVSKTWTNLWTCAPSLSFTDPLVSSCVRNKTTTGFMNFVDKVLELRNPEANIQNFHIKLREVHKGNTHRKNFHENPNNKSDPDRVKSWISYAAKHGIEDLRVWIESQSCGMDCAWCRMPWPTNGLEFNFPEPIQLPEFLFTCRTIKVLQLISNIYCFRLPPTSFILQHRLQVLHLEGIWCDKEDWISTALANCPLLETLVIRYLIFGCSFDLCISSQHLRKLVLTNFRTSLFLHNPQVVGISVHAPNLTWLELGSLPLNNDQDWVSNTLKSSPLLKTLVVEDIAGGDWIPVAFASCPFLRTLVIRHCSMYKLREIHISSRYLKNLELKNMYGMDDSFETKIYAPNLTSLTLISWASGMLPKRYAFGNLEYLVKADIGIGTMGPVFHVLEEEVRQVMKLLNHLSNLKALTILKPDSISAISEQAKFSNLRFLELHVWLYGASIVPLKNLLNNSPHMETLVMVKIEKNNWKREGTYELEGTLDHLKTLKMKNFNADEDELEFLKAALKNALVLKNVMFTIDDRSRCNISWSVGDIKKRMEKTELEKFERASSDISFSFIYPCTSLECERFNLQK